MDCAYRVAYDRLNALAENGLVTSRDVGSTKLWLAADKEQPEAPA